MIYESWNLWGNPFETHSLEANAEGISLFVGRRREVKNIIKRIKSATKITTVEGLNGVGKTSAINIACYQLWKESIKTVDSPTYIPCRKRFQIQNGENAQQLKRRILVEVAQTLFENGDDIPILPGHTKPHIPEDLNRWLNKVEQTSYQVGAFGGSFGYERSGTETSGFTESGIEKLIEDWLEEIFPDTSNGAILCIMDNLELLQTSKNARKVFEEMRDSVLQIKGIRWILCGAQGIFYSFASSPRLEGYLHRPIEILDLDLKEAGEILNVRLNHFSNGGGTTSPMTPDDFTELFDVFHGNLRSVLGACDEFCHWLHDEEEDGAQDLRFSDWLDHEITLAYMSVKSEIGPKTFDVFSKASQLEVFALTDHKEFGFEKPDPLRHQIRILETLGLVTSSQDETDKRRKTIQVTPKGWKVAEHLKRELSELL